jgi:hypothetical protein
VKANNIHPQPSKNERAAYSDSEKLFWILFIYLFTYLVFFHFLRMAECSALLWPHALSSELISDGVSHQVVLLAVGRFSAVSYLELLDP